MTPELEKELKALRLRANFDPKRCGGELRPFRAECRSRDGQVLQG